jgi:hypothetical protein
MVQRTKREGSTGLLGAFPGILGAIAFGFVLSFGIGSTLPLHIAGTVGSAAFQGLNMVNNEPFAFSCKFPSFRTGVRAAELMLCVIGTKDSPVRVPDARLAPSTGERGNSKQ